MITCSMCKETISEEQFFAHVDRHQNDDEQLLKAAHESIDILFAALICRDDNFRPSMSGKPWETIVAINKRLHLASPD